MLETREAAIRHGGDLVEARRRFPGAPEPFIDLSTGINPVAYDFDPLPPEAFARLPDPAAVLALQAVAARAYGAPDPAMVVAAPGTQVLISLLPRLLPQTAVSVLEPTYAEHAASWRAAGSDVHAASSAAALADHPAAVLCNPNNPDGRIVDPRRLRALAAGLRLLVVDEAFADFEPDASIVPHLSGAPGIVVLRSFGKAYGLAGVRLGFAVADVATAATIRRALGPWAVSGAALRIGMQAFADPGWAGRSAERLRADAAGLDALLEAAGCRVLGGTALFRLAGSPSAAALAERLGRCGIFVRTYAEHPHWLRFGLPGPADWDRLRAALAP